MKITGLLIATTFFLVGGIASAASYPSYEGSRNDRYGKNLACIEVETRSGLPLEVCNYEIQTSIAGSDGVGRPGFRSGIAFYAHSLVSECKDFFGNVQPGIYAKAYLQTFGYSVAGLNRNFSYTYENAPTSIAATTLANGQKVIEVIGTNGRYYPAGNIRGIINRSQTTEYIDIERAAQLLSNRCPIGEAGGNGG